MWLVLKACFLSMFNMQKSSLLWKRGQSRHWPEHKKTHPTANLSAKVTTPLSGKALRECFTHFIQQFSNEEFEEGLSYLDKKTPAISVGQGNGAFEQFVINLGFTVIGVDPHPEVYRQKAKNTSQVRKPDYPLLKDVPLQKTPATLLLISARPYVPGEIGKAMGRNPSGYDAEAFKNPDWNWESVVYLVERTSTAGGLDFLRFLSQLEQQEDLSQFYNSFDPSLQDRLSEFTKTMYLTRVETGGIPDNMLKTYHTIFKQIVDTGEFLYDFGILSKTKPKVPVIKYRQGNLEKYSPDIDKATLETFLKLLSESNS